jgi:outer membrane receptor protein involved in Fe transport
MRDGLMLLPKIGSKSHFIYLGVCTAALISASPTLAGTDQATVGGNAAFAQAASSDAGIQLAVASVGSGASGPVNLADAEPSSGGTASSSTDVETVVVTSSRVAREGYVAPANVTVLNAKDLAIGSPTNVYNALLSLPAFVPSVNQSFDRANNAAGQNFADLRDLGYQRTLVLLDGARNVTTGVQVAGFDMATIPSILINRVEVVTGGASAQWGSEAVAGVINIVMDHKFEGLKGSIQDGGDTQGYATNEFKADLAYGTNFDDGRGHFEIGGSFDYTKSSGPISRSAISQYGTLVNPSYTATCGCAQALFVGGLLNNNANLGGLITAGPLKGTKFLPAGATGTFQYGQYATAGTLMSGGDASAALYSANGALATGLLSAPIRRSNIYTEFSYALTPHTNLTFDFTGNLTQQLRAPYTDFFSQGNITISKSNAYLPAQVVAAMTANNITTFTLGRDNADFGKVTDANTIGVEQFKVGVNGDFGEGWLWDVRYGYGQSQHSQRIGNEPVAANLTNSINAVVSPTTGQPVCAIALTNPSTTCVPVNLFGYGSPSPAALSYFEGTSSGWAMFSQHELAANLKGEPFSLWAGPVSIATGLEYRILNTSGHADPLTQASAFSFSSAAYIGGNSYSVAEGYFEAVVPLLKDLPFTESLDLDAAVRASGYSSFGTYPSWKVGLTDRMTDEITLQGSLSHDIRAPTLAELYTLPIYGTTSVIANGTQYSAGSQFGGNANLTPELADTWSGGVTYAPSWFPGFSAHGDYYTTKINNAIVQTTAQNLVNQCYGANLQAACSVLTVTNGKITYVPVTYINLASYKSAGIDLDASYSTDLSGIGLPGELNAKLLGTYITELKQSYGTSYTPIAGDIGANAPRVRSTFTLAYDLDEFEFTGRMRFYGAGAYTLTQTVNTRVPAQAFFDLGGSWKLPNESVSAVLYGDIGNITNQIDPVAITANQRFYDPIGRTYKVGIRFGL